MKKIIFAIIVVSFVLTGCSKLTFLNTNSKTTGKVVKSIIAQTPPNTNDITSIDFYPPFDRISLAAIVNKKAVLVTNNDISPEYDEIIWGPYFSPTSLSLENKTWEPYTGPATPAYMARLGKDIYLFRDNKKIAGPYDDVDRYGATILKDGEVVFRGTRNNKVYVHYKDRNYGPYDEVLNNDSITVSKDGDHVAWTVQKGNKQIVVLDGKEQTAYGAVNSGYLVFAPDNTFGYMASKQTFIPRQVLKNVVLVINGKETGMPFVIEGWPTMNVCALANGKFKLIAAVSTESCNTVTDWREEFNNKIAIQNEIDAKMLADSSYAKRYKNVSNYVSSVSNHAIFFATNKEEPTTNGGTIYKDQFIVIDGKEGPHFTSVFVPPVVSAHKDEITYGAYDENSGQFYKVTQSIK